uniref:HDC19712 n=1 Tax=Drosophila melanogaster TaxID=7227 RepID=Q6II52_DROME|nr:TPA_inf: HDC19712 [Drosophila melanogaster]
MSTIVPELPIPQRFPSDSPDSRHQFLRHSGTRSLHLTHHQVEGSGVEWSAGMMEWRSGVEWCHQEAEHAVNNATLSQNAKQKIKNSSLVLTCLQPFPGASITVTTTRPPPPPHSSTWHPLATWHAVMLHGPRSKAEMYRKQQRQEVRHRVHPSLAVRSVCPL